MRFFRGAETEWAGQARVGFVKLGGGRSPLVRRRYNQYGDRQRWGERRESNETVVILEFKKVLKKKRFWKEEAPGFVYWVKACILAKCL